MFVECVENYKEIKQLKPEKCLLKIVLGCCCTLVSI